MIINAGTLRDLFQGFDVSFNKGLKNASSFWDKVAMRVPSSAAAENYSWLSDMPAIREWLGDRVINGLSAARYVIENKQFELTVSVSRTKIEDDQYGIYGVVMEKLGHDVGLHPDNLVFSILKSGFTKYCYDELFFFDTDHKGYDETGAEISVSNFQAGTDPAWYLLDCSQPIRPLIYQKRRPVTFISMDDPKDANVFFRNEYIYGTDGRSNAGYGRNVSLHFVIGNKGAQSTQNALTPRIFCCHLI